MYTAKPIPNRRNDVPQQQCIALHKSQFNCDQPEAVGKEDRGNMVNAHYRKANGMMWSRQLFFGKPLWQLTLGGSIVAAVIVTPTLFKSWRERYRSSYIDYSTSNEQHMLQEEVKQAVIQHPETQQHHHHDVHHEKHHHVPHGECPEHPHVHSNEIHVDVHDIAHHDHNVILKRLDKQRKWIMFG